MKEEKKLSAKKIFIACTVVLCIVVVCISAFKQCSDANDRANTLVRSYNPFDYKSDVGYYTPQQGEDIFKDEKYLEKNRYMTVDYQGTRITYTKDDIDTAQLSVQMLQQYFDAAVNGDGATLNTLFTDYYFDNLGDPIEKYDDEFYQQKIYNIEIVLHSGPTTVQSVSGNITREIFQVSYYVMDNNGAFRPDLPEPEEGTVPLFFEVLTQNGQAKINQIFVYSE